MSRDNVNTDKQTAKQDMSWDTLIKHSESEIAVCRKRIGVLRKSLKFFRQQVETGAKFPTPRAKRKT
jgi:hypothetical protein